METHSPTLAETLFKILLIIHITGGSASLLLGLYMLIAKKGDRRHKLVGKIYFFAMLAAALVALPMAYLHTNYFLFIIGVFTSYMLLSGTRALQKKQAGDAQLVDWALSVVMLLFGVAFIVLGAILMLQSNIFGIVLVVFGSISLLFVYQDFTNFRGRSKLKNFGLTTHLQRMIGSYIASVTAFLVVNNTILPGAIAWLIPTVTMVPLILRWSRKYGMAKTMPEKGKSN
jgi:uncharacterized membrane protein